MIILKTFPLSFSIFWRFMLVLPLWAVFYMVITVISFYGVLQLFSGIPVVGLLFLILAPFALFAIVSIVAIHPYLIGIGIGLKVLGVKSKASQKSLLGSAVGYGVIEGLAAYLFSITIFAAAFYLLQSDGELADALNAKSFRDPMAALSRQIAFGTLTVLGALSAIFGMILRAALLPALASAAAGCDPNSHRHTVYDGIGEKFPQMMGLLAMIAVISTVLLPFIGEASQYIGLTSVLVEKLQTLLQAVTGDRDLVFDLTLAIAIFLAISFSVWLFCLQCAGAALSYESRVTDEVQVKLEAVKSREASHVDIAALRRARMNNIGR